MKIFKYEAFNVHISEEALSLKPFKALWTRDKTSTKGKAIEELSYVYFMCDPRSDYQYLVDIEERSSSVKEGLGLPKTWKPDKQIQEAMKFYDSFKSTSALLLEDTRTAIDKVREFLKNVDLNALDDKGKPLYTINSITSTIKMIPQLIKDLDEAEKIINSEMREQGITRGQKSKSIMEDM